MTMTMTMDTMDTLPRLLDEIVSPRVHGPFLPFLPVFRHPLDDISAACICVSSEHNSHRSLFTLCITFMCDRFDNPSDSLDWIAGLIPTNLRERFSELFIQRRVIWDRGFIIDCKIAGL